MSTLPSDHREYFQVAPGMHPSDVDEPCEHKFGPDGDCTECGDHDEGSVDPEWAAERAEAAHERFMERFYGGSEPVTMDEQHRAAYEEHRRLHR